MNEANLKDARILLLDDDVGSTCLLANFLHRLGYKNLEAINDPNLIFQKIEESPPDLILLDLAMPNLNGFQVLQALRQGDEDAESIPVLVLSGDATAANKRKALAAGANDIVAKPFDASEMSMRIRTLLQARLLRIEVAEQNRLLEARVRERTAQLEEALGDLRNAQRQMMQQERLSAFGEMAGGVVHDFSNALMSIIGYSDILLTNPSARSEDETVRDYLSIINTAGRDGAHIVSRLRDFYRPRGVEDVFERLDLNEIARQSIALARPRASRRSASQAVALETDLAQEVSAQGIAPELREVLTNLIFNAIDAIPETGTVTLTTSASHEHAILEVSDTGVGMSAEVRSRCLDPFYTTKGENGTGLGLAMAFGIIQRHQGLLEIESQLGLGTTFRIRLPLAPSVKGQGAVPNPLVPPDFFAAEPLLTC